MTTKMSTAIGKSENGADAAKNAAEKALNKLNAKTPDLAVLYCSSKYDYQTVVSVVRSVIGADCPLIGCSTAGEFTEEGAGKGCVSLALIKSDDMIFNVDLARNIDEDLEIAVSNIVNIFQYDYDGYPYRCAFMLADGLVGNGEELTLILSNMAGLNTTIIGGLAADDFQMKKTVVFCNDVVADKAAAICLISSRKPLAVSYNHGHIPLSEPIKLTKTDKNKLIEVDGKPAWDVWIKETADAAAELGVNTSNLEEKGKVGEFLSNFELGLRVGKESYKVRYPMSKNPDGSINFTCTIPEGTSACIMHGGDKERQIEAARTAALQVKDKAARLGIEKFAGALAIECAVRQYLLGDDFPKVVRRLTETLPETPIIGCETYGEICMEPGEFSGYHNTTTVLLLLPE